MEPQRLHDIYEARMYGLMFNINRDTTKIPEPIDDDRFRLLKIPEKVERRDIIPEGTEEEWRALREQWKEYTMARRLRREKIDG